MASMRFTDTNVETLRWTERDAEPSGEVCWQDALLPGLVLRLRQSGSKSWSVRYRIATKPYAGPSQRITLGSYPAKLGIGRTTLLRLIKDDERVEAAVAIGKAALADECTHLLMTAARKGNIVAAIYLTKARLGWREGDAAEQRPNITINLPDAQTPEAYMRMVNQTHAPLLTKDDDNAD